MAQVESDCERLLPVAQRAARLIELRREIDALHLIESALVELAIGDGLDEVCSPQTPPWAVLGVEVAAR